MDFYQKLLQGTALEVRQTAHGEGLFTTCDAQPGYQFVEDVPIICYPTPLKHWAWYQLNGNTAGFCFNCLKALQPSDKLVTCSHHDKNCLHVYCSEECRDKHWLNGHWLMCLDWNRPNYAKIKQMMTNKDTWNDYFVSEILAGFIAKTIIQMINGVPSEQAITRVL